MKSLHNQEQMKLAKKKDNNTYWKGNKMKFEFKIDLINS